MRAPGGGRWFVSKKQWVEPQPDWMPLRRAVFQFDMIDKKQPYLGLSYIDQQLIIRALAHVIARGGATLYARTPTLTSPFERLLADAWPLLKITDLRNGIAVAPDGIRYWSIHVEPSASEAVAKSASKRPPSMGDIDTFVENYIDGEKKAGRSPTQVGCADAWATGHRGGRERIRKRFKDIQEAAGHKVEFGRPRHRDPNS
jgi:hypothetical protein